MYVRLEDDGIVTRCEITTFDASEIFDLPYNDEERLQKLILNVSTAPLALGTAYGCDRHLLTALIILQSSWLSEALTEIDSSCERVTLKFKPTKAVNTSYQTQQSGNNGGNLEDEDEDGDMSNFNTQKTAFSLEAKSNTGSVEVNQLSDCPSGNIN